MEMKFVDGDYVHDGCGGFETVSGAGEVLNRVLFKLSARRGGFELMPELGSRLYTLFSCKGSMLESLAREYILEAVSGEQGLTLTSVELESVESDTLNIRAVFEYNGERLETVTEVDI